MAKRKGKDKTQGLVNDAAKALLANIRFLSVDDPVKTILITSAIPNEGKTFVSVNLAQAIASSGKLCLLLEGDLRKRSLAKSMGIHPEHGLYSVLSGDVAFADAAVATPQRNLYFLDAEPQIPNPSDLFGSTRFSTFLAEVSRQVDYVVIDTAPVTTFVDGAVISAHVDKTFLVVRENFTKRRFVQAAYEQLLAAGADVGGVIMNDCVGGDGGYYSYYDYYSYYYSEEDESKPAPAPKPAPKPASAPAPAQHAAQHVEYDPDAAANVGASAQDAAAAQQNAAAQYSREAYQQGKAARKRAGKKR